MSSSATSAGRSVWKLFKIVFSILLIGFALWVIVPRLNEVASTDAVVTARALMIRAPEAGTVAECPRRSGITVTKGQTIVTLDIVSDSRAAKALDDDLNAFATRIKALEDQYNANETARKQPENADKRADFLIAQANLGATLAEARKRSELLRAATVSKPHVAVATPIEGLVWRALTQPGKMVAAHDPLVQVLDTDSFFVDCSVHRDDVQYIQPGGKASVKILGQSQWLEGTVESVLSPESYDEQLDFAVAGPRVRSNEYRVLVRLPQTPGLVSPQLLGMGVRATVIFGHRIGVLENLLTLSR